MKISVDINEEQMLRLKNRAVVLGLQPDELLEQLIDPYINATDEEFEMMNSIAAQFGEQFAAMEMEEDDEEWEEDDEDEDWDEDEEEWEEDDEEWDEDDEEWEEDEDWDEDDWDEEEDDDDEDFEACVEGKVYSISDALSERVN